MSEGVCKGREHRELSQVRRRGPRISPWMAETICRNARLLLLPYAYLARAPRGVRFFPFFFFLSL